jgi:UDP-glucose 4-epimerase
MRSLVTGGSGFIGSNLVDSLLARGDEVVVVDDLSTGRRENLDSALANGAELVEADIRDAEAMAELGRERRPEQIFHLAAQIDVRRSVTDPSTDVHVNVGGTAAVLEAARLHGARRVLLASTAGVYGEPELVPTPEEAPAAPLSPYGASKAAAETYMSLFRRLHGISTLSLRLSNVYGPRQDPGGESGVVAIFAGAAAAGRPARIYGDGMQTRDFVFVADVVRAFVAAGRCRAEGVVNVASGRETRIRDLAAAVGVTTDFAPARQGEVYRSSLRPDRARELLGWRAMTDIRDGIARMT